MNRRFIKALSWVIVFVLLVLGLFYSVRCEAVTYYPAMELIDAEGDVPDFSPFDKAKLIGDKKMSFLQLSRLHKLQAVELLERAENHVWWCPETKDKDKALAFYQAAIAGVASATPQTRLAAMFLSLLTSYGMAVIEEYHVIADLVYDAKYHMELSDFYLELALKS